MANIKSDRRKSNMFDRPDIIQQEEETLVEINEKYLSIGKIDTDNIILLKEAYKKAIPSKFGFIDENNEVVFLIDIISEITGAIDQIEPLESIYLEYNKNLPELTYEDWIFMYYNVFGDDLTKSQFLELTNLFLMNQGIAEMDSDLELDEAYGKWEDVIEKQSIKESQILNEIIEKQKVLLNEKPKDYIDIKITNEQYDFIVSLPENTEINKIVLEAELNDEIPALLSTFDPTSKSKFGQKEKTIYRVKDGFVSENYYNLFPWNNDLLSQRIYFIINEELVVWNITTNIITINVSTINNDVNKAKELLKRVFDIKIIDVQPRNLKGTFNIMNVSVGIYSFSDLIANDTVGSAYFVSEEGTTLVSEKKRIYFKFRSYELGAKISQSFIIEGEKKGDNSYKVGTPYITVSVTGVTDNNLFNKFIYILSLLMSYYMRVKDNLESLYSNWIGSNRESPLELQRPGQTKIKSKNQLLKVQHPDVFRNNYSRQCQIKNQPTIVIPGETQVPENRDVLYFPPPSQGEQLFEFYCPNDEAPYPTVIDNNSDNKETYPFVPCCLPSDPSKHKDSAYYRLYIQKEDVDAVSNTKTSSKYTMRTNKIMTYLRKGTLPTTIKQLLELNATQEFFRYGMVKSPSSLLHCIAYALKLPKYLKAKDDDAREKVVKEIRGNIKVNPEVMAQEMWDVEPEKRIKQLLNPSSFLDPRLFIHAIEEAFKCTLFLFSGYNEDLTLIRPRHSQFYSKLRRPLDEKQKDVSKTCIIIYLHEDEKQCELIMMQPDNASEEVSIFDNFIQDKLFRLFEKLYQINTYSYDKNNKLIPLINLPYEFDESVGWSAKASYQILDSFGHCRGLVFSNGGTIIFDPIQPFNLPDYYSNEDHNDKPLPRWKSYEQADKVLDVGKPNEMENDKAIIYRDEKNITAIFVLLDKKSSFKDKAKTNYVVDLRVSGYRKNKPSILQQRTFVGWFMQIITLLFIIDQIQNRTNKKKKSYKEKSITKIVETFLDDWTIITDEENYMYDLDHDYEIKLPSPLEKNTLFEYISEQCSNCVINNKLILPSSIFRERLTSSLSEYYKHIIGMEEHIKLPAYLLSSKIYKNAFNYNQSKSIPLLSDYPTDTPVITDIRDLTKYKTNKVILISYKEDESETLYILQNVENDKNASIRWEAWKNKNKNTLQYYDTEKLNDHQKEQQHKPKSQEIIQ